MIKIAPSIGSRGVGILSEKIHLDHLIPLCQLIGIPILVIDRELREMADLYYPPMEVIEHEPEECSLDAPLAPFDYVVYTEPTRTATGNFQFKRFFSTRKIRSIFTHHGNSEKSFRTYWFERLVDEDVLLVYGQHMRDHFDKIGFTKPMQRCGNYRLAYYQKHRPFFDAKVAPHLFGETGRKTVLYAPTWAASELQSERRFDYSTALETYHWVLDAIPDGYQVLVKLHPLFFALMPDAVQKMIDEYADHPQIKFIHDLPLIYPLLERVDIYVGDFSSVGYDFLYFDRPMFFLTDEREWELFKCGIPLRVNAFWKGIEQSQDHLSPARRKLYNYAFGEGICTSIS